MKIIISWIIRFIVWVVLYYILFTKVFNSIFDSSITTIKEFNLHVLYFAIIISFAMSFLSKLMSWNNIKKHLYVVLATIAIPVVLKIINFSIDMINWGPSLRINTTISIIENAEYGRGCLNSMGNFYMWATGLILAALISFTYTGEYEDDYLGCDGDEEWD